MSEQNARSSHAYGRKTGIKQVQGQDLQYLNIHDFCENGFVSVHQ